MRTEGGAAEEGMGGVDKRGGEEVKELLLAPGNCFAERRKDLVRVA